MGERIDKFIRQSVTSECQRLADLITKGDIDYRKLYYDWKNAILEQEYATGGETIYRGFYCPSPIYDILMGGCNRGRILKRFSNNSRPTYVYGFAENHKLVITDFVHSEWKEVLIDYDNTVIGIAFDKEEVTAISECIYQSGKISSFGYGLYNAHADKLFDFYKEVYHYSECGLESAETVSYINNAHMPVLQCNRYHFQHDNEGYLSSFSLEGILNPESEKANPIYCVRVKRKV